MVTLNNTTIAALLAVGLAAPASAQQVTTFNGPCDASAAVALDAAHFIVANDVTAVHETEQLQQAGEEVEDRDEQRHRGHHVVGLAAVDDVAGLVEDQAGHQQHEGRRDGQRQRRDLEEDRRQAGKEGEQDADHQEAAHEAEVLLRRQRVGRQAEEDRGGAGHRLHHDLAAVGQAEVATDDRAERVAHEAGQANTARMPQPLSAAWWSANSRPK
jgi:hypothetical protein